MSILSPLAEPSLTRERLAEILASDAVTDPYPHLLRWLIWFPLLSVEEITRLEQSRLAKSKQTRSRESVAAYLLAMEQLQLISHLIVNEPGWPPHQHRYFLTDVGLYVFAALSNPPLSVRRLVQAYAIERADLIARLARIDTHLVLSEFSTKLVLEGSNAGYPVTSFQQPWTQTDTIFGHRRTLRLDAALLIASPQGTEHAFYIRIDANERCPFAPRREHIMLRRLLDLRHAYHLQHEAIPRLLIITRVSRLTEWSTLLEKVSAELSTALLDGAITTLEHLQRGGPHGPIWWTFAEVTQAMAHGSLTHLTPPSVLLSSLIGKPASQALAERFSQRRTFAHLRTSRNSGPLRKTKRPLPSYIGKPLTHEITTLRSTSLSDVFCGTRTEQQEATALLNLALSAMQKDLLFWLTHHPLLSIHHLMTLHHPGGQDIRGVQKQMTGLSQFTLLVPFTWYGPRSWHERERYTLAEAALRYQAIREGRQATYYLLPEKYRKKNAAPGLSIQRGASGLFAQMEHTHGLYDCMTRLVAGGYREKIRLITWKSAHESIRWYRDPFTGTLMQIRPDGEVIYLVDGQMIPHTILVEYDRATSTKREYEAKYLSYADYQEYTRLILPPILVITQDDQTRALIHSCIDMVGPNLPVIIVLEEQVQHQGLLSLLTLLDSSS